MERKYNSEAFTPEEVKAGLDRQFIDALLDLDDKNESSSRYHEILITSDGYCRIVNWVGRDFDKDYGGLRFECLDEDEFVDAEVMMDPSTDGPMEFRRRSDLEDPDYRESSGIEYNPEAGTWKYKTETDDGKSTEPAAGKTETRASAKAKKGTKKK